MWDSPWRANEKRGEHRHRSDDRTLARLIGFAGRWARFERSARSARGQVNRRALFGKDALGSRPINQERWDQAPSEWEGCKPRARSRFYPVQRPFELVRAKWPDR